MKNFAIFFVSILGFAGLALVSSCSNDDDKINDEPAAPEKIELGVIASNTSCKDEEENGGDGPAATFKMENGSLVGSYSNFTYDCNFSRVHVSASLCGDTLCIIDRPEYEGADCRCEVDVEFTVKGISPGRYILKLAGANSLKSFSTNLPSEYYSEYTRYEGAVEFSGDDAVVLALGK